MELRIIFGKDNFKTYEITEREVQVIAECIRGNAEFVEFTYNGVLVVLSKTLLQSQIIEISKTQNELGNNPSYYF